MPSPTSGPTPEAGSSASSSTTRPTSLSAAAGTATSGAPGAFPVRAGGTGTTLLPVAGSATVMGPPRRARCPPSLPKRRRPRATSSTESPSLCRRGPATTGKGDPLPFARSLARPAARPESSPLSPSWVERPLARHRPPRLPPRRNKGVRAGRRGRGGAGEAGRRRRRVRDRQSDEVPFPCRPPPSSSPVLTPAPTLCPPPPPPSLTRSGVRRLRPSRRTTPVRTWDPTPSLKEGSRPVDGTSGPKPGLCRKPGDSVETEPREFPLPSAERRRLWGTGVKYLQ